MPIFITKGGRIAERPASLKSEELEELISHRPSFFVRRGMSLIFLVLAALMLGFGWISYPETVQGSAALQSLNPPEPVRTEQGGILRALNVKDGDYVNSGAVIGYLHTTANVSAVIELRQQLDSFALVFEKDGSIIPLKLRNLGELQTQAQVFREALIRYKESLPGGAMEKKAAFIIQDIRELKKLKQTVGEQGDIQKEDAALSTRTFEMNERLWKEKVISDLEYREQKSLLLSKQMSAPQNRAAIIQNEKERIGKAQQLSELESDRFNQRLFFAQALRSFVAQVDQWKRQYLLTADRPGKISFHSPVQIGQQLRPGEALCYITGTRSNYYARMMIGQTNFGKIRKGQKVLLRLSAYPFEEFGVLNAELESISNIPSDSGFLAIVGLPQRLITDKGHELVFKEGLSASAEIILQKKSVLSRLTESLTKQIKQ